MRIGIFFIIIFIAMLIIPLTFIDLSPEKVSVQEKRVLSRYPKLADIKNHPGKFIQDFDDWFKDSTGFREQLVALYNVVEKNTLLNGIQYTDGQYTYLVGKQGHHYFADIGGSLILKYQGKPILSDNQLANMASKLEEVKIILERKGISLIVMFCADKESVYPEFYPISIKRGPEPIQLDVITSYLQENTTIDIFNIRQALLAEKNNYWLYNVSFGDLTHYNEIGGFFAYRELMRHIIIHFPEIIPYELEDIDIGYNEKGIPSVSLKEKNTYKKIDASIFDDIELVRPFSWENEVYENINSNLPVILILRDSYTAENYIGKFIAQHFGKTIMIHYTNMEHFKEYITWCNPDIVIFESAERMLPSFSNKITKIPTLQ